MARRIHGISDDMVADAPIFASLAMDVQARLDGAVLVAHNASVDLGVLKRKLPSFAPDEVLDTLRLARRLLPDQPNHRLGSLVSALDLGRDLPRAGESGSPGRDIRERAGPRGCLVRDRRGGVGNVDEAAVRRPRSAACPGVRQHGGDGIA